MHEIYLDNAATTKVDSAVAAVATELMCTDYGNPSSLHTKGLAAQRKIDLARQQIAAGIGCLPEEIHFTSGGTEANNLAVFGSVQALGRRGKTIVASALEHASVLEPFAQLEKQGFTVRLIPPDASGAVDSDAFVSAVDEDTILVSCMQVNSETGAIFPVQELTKRIRRKNKLARIHCDAVQAFGKIPVSVAQLGVDLLTISAHKIHAPKGCGALYIRTGCRTVPRSFGGKQERGMRAGTESVPLIGAFGYAAQTMLHALDQHFAHANILHSKFWEHAADFSGLCINSPMDGSPYIYNISLPDYHSETLLHYLAQRGIYVSSGSACTKGAASHVLTAMGLSSRQIGGALRISLSQYTTVQEIDTFFTVLRQAVQEIQPVHLPGRKS